MWKHRTKLTKQTLKNMYTELTVIPGDETLQVNYNALMSLRISHSKMLCGKSGING